MPAPRPYDHPSPNGHQARAQISRICSRRPPRNPEPRIMFAPPPPPLFPVNAASIDQVDQLYCQLTAQNLRLSFDWKQTVVAVEPG